MAVEARSAKLYALFIFLAPLFPMRLTPIFSATVAVSPRSTKGKSKKAKRNHVQIDIAVLALDVGDHTQFKTREVQ